MILSVCSRLSVSAKIRIAGSVPDIRSSAQPFFNMYL